MNKKVALSLLSATVVASMASSALAAPKSGVYLGGEVDRYYAFEDLFKLTEAGNAKFGSDLSKVKFENIVYVDRSGTGATMREIFNASDYDKAKRTLKETDFEGVYTQSNIDGSNGATYDPRKDAVPGPVGELKVESVNVLNAKEIVVDFDDELDTVTAEDESNYELKISNLPVSAFNVTVDSTDKTKAVITLDGKIKTGDYVSLTVKKTVLNKNLSGLEQDDTKAFSFVDTTAPAIKAVQVKGNNVVVSFDEYVSAIGLITIDNKNVSIPSTSPAVKEITLTDAAKGLTAGQHTIALANVKDIQDAANTASYLTKTFDVTVDTAAPAVSKVEAAGEYKFKVVFDKEVSVPTIAVKKNGYALTSSVAPVDGIGTDDEYYVTVSNNGQITVYGENETTANLSVTVGGYKAVNNDMFGNEFTNTVTLSKDGAAPTIVNRFSKVVDKDPGTAVNEVFHVQFSEELSDTVDSNKIVLKDKDGVKKAISGATVVADTNGKKTILEVASTAVQASGTINAGTYTIDLGAAAVKDLGNNPNAAASVSITKSGAPQGEIDLAGKIGVSGNNVITINYGVDMTPVATSLSNYKLNGQPIKANAIYFSGDKKTVVIELQDETIASSGDALLTIADSVVAEDGSKLKTDSKNIVVNNFKDNVDPVLVSAKKESSTSLVLTFSEDVVVTNDDAHLDDFVVRVNGTVVDATYIGSVDGDAKKVTLTLPQYNTSQTVTVATYKSDLNTKDKSSLNNTLKVNTTPITAN